MEIVIVIAIMGVLSTITIQAIGPAKARYSVGAAKTALATMTQRARAHAVEGGGSTILTMDFAGDSAVVRRGSDVLETFRFDDELDVDMASSGTNQETVCMNSKGYADPRCTSFTNRLTVTFSLAGVADSLDILPLGQVVF